MKAEPSRSPPFSAHCLGSECPEDTRSPPILAHFEGWCQPVSLGGRRRRVWYRRRVWLEHRRPQAWQGPPALTPRFQVQLALEGEVQLCLHNMRQNTQHALITIITQIVRKDTADRFCTDTCTLLLFFSS